MSDDPFATALDALFTSAGSVAATYADEYVGERAIRVIRSRPDHLARFGDTLIMPATNIFDIRVSDVAEPRMGAALSIGQNAFEITVQPLLDVEGVSWACGAELVA